MNTNYSVRNGEVYSKHIFAGNTRLATKMEKRKGTGAPTDLGLYYYHGDHLGSSNAITNRSGKFHEHVEYFPYGETWVEERVAGGENLPHKFTGKEQDPETGLYYYGYRYLDPKLGDWISADPPLAKGDYLPVPAISDEAKEHNSKLPGMGGVFNSINLDAYQYAGRNPIKFVDPDGDELYWYSPFNADLGMDYGNEAGINIKQGNYGTAALNIVAGSCEAGYNMLGIYGAAKFAQSVPVVYGNLAMMRQAYNDGAAKIGNIAQQMKAAGKSAEDIARKLVL